MLLILAQDLFDASSMKGMVQQCPWAVAACVIVWLVLKAKRDDKKVDAKVQVDNLKAQAEQLATQQAIQKEAQDGQLAQAQMCHAFQREMHQMTSQAMKAMADAMLATSIAYGANTKALETNGQCMRETTEMLRDTARILQEKR